MTRFTIAVLLLPLQLCMAADWPQWRGVNRDGVSAESVEPWQGDLKPAWRSPVGEGHSSPVVANGTVYIHAKVAGVEKEEVIALDAKNGSEKWRKAYDRARYANQYGNGPRATPLVDGDRLYTLGVTGILICWNSKDGTQLWQKDILKEFQARNLFFGVSTTPLIDGDRLLVMPGGPNASIVALDKKSGDLLWKAGKDPASYASPILTKQGDTPVAIFLTQKGVTGLNPANGEIYWHAPLVDLLNESSTTPVLSGETLFAGSVTFGALGLQLTTKDNKPAFEERWKSQALTCYFATPVAVRDHLYTVTGKLVPPASLECVEAKSGKVLWTKKNVGKFGASLILCKNKMLMLEEGGDLVLFQPDAKEYKELARAKVCGETWAHPALSDGWLFVRDRREVMGIRFRTSD